MSDSTAMARPYWERLQIDRPRLERYVNDPDLKLWHLLGAALIEHGRPAPLRLLAERLARAGVAAPGSLETAIRRSWHGVAPVVREPDGLLALDLSSREIDRLLFVLRLRLVARRREAPAPPPPPEGADTDPLTIEEVDAAFRERSLWPIGALRPAAAVLDAHGRPMTVFEIERALNALTTHRPRLDAKKVRAWRTDLVVVSPDGRLVLNRASAALVGMRRFVRKRARPAIVDRWKSQHLRQAFATAEAEEARLDLERAAAARDLRHLLVRVAPAAGAPVAAALIDVQTREIWSLHGDDLATLPARLRAYDVLAGIEIRRTLRSLGLDPDRWRLADLRPPRKTMRISRHGRTLTLTPSLVVSSTTGLARPLADPAQVARYLANGDIARLTRRLVADAKALAAFYAYGRLHRAVRIRWGFIDERLPVDWPTPADRHVFDVLREATTTRASVEVVLGAAPPWTDPWAGAQRVRVVASDMWNAVLQSDVGQFLVAQADIQAIRMAVAEVRRARPGARVLRWPHGAAVL